MTTDTPRTDACPHCGADIAYEAAGERQFMCGSWSFHTKTDRPYKCRYYEVQIRAERAEAEVERMKINLLRAVEIAVNLSWDYADTEYDAELDALKATINPDNK